MFLGSTCRSGLTGLILMAAYSQLCCRQLLRMTLEFVSLSYRLWIFSFILVMQVAGSILCRLPYDVFMQMFLERFSVPSSLPSDNDSPRITMLIFLLVLLSSQVLLGLQGVFAFILESREIGQWEVVLTQPILLCLALLRRCSSLQARYELRCWGDGAGEREMGWVGNCSSSRSLKLIFSSNLAALACLEVSKDWRCLSLWLLNLLVLGGLDSESISRTRMLGLGERLVLLRVIMIMHYITHHSLFPKQTHVSYHIAYASLQCCAVDNRHYKMKLQRANSKSAEQSLVSNIRERLSINNIFREFELVANMTRNLDVKFKAFCRLEPLRQLQREEVLRVVRQVPFLSLVLRGRTGEQQEYVNIKYENSHKVLLVTGVTKEAIEEMLKNFDSFPLANHHPSKRSHPRIIANNGFWVTIETSCEDQAAALKKYIRSKKRINDQTNTTYKVEGRRIRIVMLKEDFLSILIDAMTEIKSELFQKQFQLPTPPVIERRKSQDETVLIAELRKKTLLYRPIIVNPYYPKNELEEKELSDGFSESNSLSSDILDSNKIKDLIETSEQGIQSESNAEFAHSEPERPPSEEASLPKEEPVKEESKEPMRELAVDVQQVREEVVQRKTPSKESKEDDPFISTEMFAAPEEEQPPSAAIQTQDTFLSPIPYSLMKRLLQEFKQMRSTSQLIELPEWIKSESEEERNRHRFFDSLCRPKIIQKRSKFQ